MNQKKKKKKNQHWNSSLSTSPEPKSLYNRHGSNSPHERTHRTTLWRPSCSQRHLNPSSCISHIGGAFCPQDSASQCHAYQARYLCQDSYNKGANQTRVWNNDHDTRTLECPSRKHRNIGCSFHLEVSKGTQIQSHPLVDAFCRGLWAHSSWRMKSQRSSLHLYLRLSPSSLHPLHMKGFPWLISTIGCWFFGWFIVSGIVFFRFLLPFDFPVALDELVEFLLLAGKLLELPSLTLLLVFDGLRELLLTCLNSYL